MRKTTQKEVRKIMKKMIQKEMRERENVERKIKNENIIIF